jgi:class I fructose-bisphosphate aldolase
LTPRVKEILSWYGSEPLGVRTNLCRMLNHGRLAGTGKLVVLPVDQGFEHGPARSFAKNPRGYDPSYHVELAIASGCSAYAAPLGQLSQAAEAFVGEIPLILKLNNSDSLYKPDDPAPAVTSSVEDALRLGCCAIGYTIYPGSAERNAMYEELRELIADARAVGLPTVLWSYPRGSGLDKSAETKVDVIAYAAHIACQLGAHVVKVKPPTEGVGLPAARATYEEQDIPMGTLRERTAHVVQSCFGGKRIVIFSGGATKSTEAVLNDVKELAAGGAFGSIIGRNAFQRPFDEAVALLGDVMQAFAEPA